MNKLTINKKENQMQDLECSFLSPPLHDLPDADYQKYGEGIRWYGHQ